MKFLCVRTQLSWFFVVLVVAWFIAPMSCRATVTFANPEANLLMGVTNAKLRVGNASKIVGWTNRSVVKTFGNNASSAWPETYADGSIVGQLGQAGLPAVDRPARTNLVEANSNVLVIASGASDLSQLARTTSNLLLYTARTHSSSIWVLRSRADSATVSLRTMSNTLLFANALTRTTSNATNLFYSNLQVPTTDSINGTQFMRYHTGHHVFHNGASSIRGWVRFNDGFTVMPQATVSMDTLTTVSGAIDLRDTGLLKLNNDLYLAHNVTLTAGGYIKGNAANYGQANTIFMGGDLTLASDNYAKVLHITGDWANNGQSGDLIIDGCGHTLNIGSKAQIFVDQNVTLTLRNMTIKTSLTSVSKPAIQLAALSSKLALDNVMFDLGADFNFKQGQLFIHDEVAVTGTSAFIYTSPKPSYITSGATWSFESGTTFSIAPATYTDQPFTAGTATSNNFIVLADQSSALSLNNCSLKTTYTGARFTKGMVLFDNKVALDTQAGSEITGLGAYIASFDGNITISSASYSPDGQYIVATRLNPTGQVVLHQLPSDTVNAYDFGTNALPTVACSSDGRFVAAGSDAGVRIYRYTGRALSTILTQPFGILVNSVSWSPDGRYLVVAGNRGDGTSLYVYRFDGTSLTVVNWTNGPGGTIQVNGVSWHPSGKYFSYTSRSSTQAYLGVFSFDGYVMNEVSSASSSNGSGCSVAWSPDGRFLAWGYSTSGNGGVGVYSFNGNLASVQGNTLGTQVNAVSFSPDGRYLLACGANGTAGIYGLYKVNISSTTLIGSTQSFGSPGVATTVAWSPDSKYVLVGGTNGSTDLMVFPTTMTATAANTQGFSNGLLFGDSAKGVNFDANVQLLSGAVVKARGMIKDDSA
jgi:Tol biopolymer transport system component